jgi:UDP-N-acetylglucosamine--N-acetylmuramyl-(pentapeptide) pyrophosphoryl-undecaprenol N-acetylglucosamine transferase
MRKEPLRVVIAGGGTGGHLYPGIAVAREILARAEGSIVTFAGTAHGIETRVVPREGFELDVIRSAGLKGKSLAARAKGALLLPLGSVDAWRLLSARRPHLVIGVGGYSSGPVVGLAALRGIPTMVLEQNAVPGVTNRWLARLADAAAVTWEETLRYFRGRGFVSGNPVRAEFFTTDFTDHGTTDFTDHGTTDSTDSTDPGGKRRDDRTRILIFGGSQGAHAINVAMVEAAAELAERGGRLAITHQTGERDLAFVNDGYRRSGLEARVEPFLYAMDREMTAADLVISRAGATTLAELAAAGRPAILVPLPTATDDHQRKNAEATARAGAAEVIDQRELTGARLATRILALADDAPRRAAMAAAARRPARPDAARVIVDRAFGLTGS